MKKALASLVALIILVPNLPVQADSAQTDIETPTPQTQTEELPIQELIVKLERPEGTEQFETASDAEIVDTLTDDTVLVEVEGMSAEGAAAALESLPNVSYAEPNHDRSFFAIPTNDTYRAQQWALENTGQAVNGTAGTAGSDVDALRAWDLSLGTSTIVAVIDSGVAYAHPDLQARMWDGSVCVSDTGAALGSCIHGYDFADNDLDPAPVSTSTSFSHGTHVAGIIAAERNNGLGVVGIAPSAQIMALRFGMDVASAVRAIDFARQNGATIINASYGGVQPSQAERDAIQRFTDAGGIFVASAGNASADMEIAPSYPAAYDLPGIVSVAASGMSDELAAFSNYGSSSVDIAAPGMRVLSTYLSSSSAPVYAYADGTSMSAPFVAGTIALMRSAYPLLTPAEIKAALLLGGDPVPALSGSVSGTRLNAYRALVAAGGGDVTPPVITLNGSSTLSLLVGDAYTELGASVADDHDASSTATVGGDIVDAALAGTYHVTYDAADAAGNVALQRVRTVTVSALPSTSTPASVIASSGGGGGGGGGGSSSSSSSKSKSKKKKGGGGGGSSSSKTKPSSSSVLRSASPTRTLHAKTSSVLAAQPAAVPANVPAGGTPPAAAPALGTPYFFTRVLSVGSTGPDVTALQQLLQRAGLFAGPATGYFGPVTAASLRAYQARHGLEQVGVTGPLTRAKLNAGS